MFEKVKLNRKGDLWITYKKKQKEYIRKCKQARKKYEDDMLASLKDVSDVVSFYRAFSKPGTKVNSLIKEVGTETTYTLSIDLL